MIREDIYNWQGKHEHLKREISKSKRISDKNKKLIFQFDSDCATIEKTEVSTRCKYFHSLSYIAKEYLKKNFDELTREDFKGMVKELDDKKSIGNAQKYRSVLKKFGRWLAHGDEALTTKTKEYPNTVSFINTNIKKKDKTKLKASDILTEEEVKKLFISAEHPRDKCFIYLLYELGARISEIGNLTLEDCHKDKYGYKIDLDGKTGRRTSRIVFSTPILTRWLNQHPFRDNPKAPMWITYRDYNSHREGKKSSKKGTKVNYVGLSKIVKRLVAKAGIGKRVYAHLFRHSRVTHLLKNKMINESQSKVYFGWTPESEMLSCYQHLTSSDIDDVILELNGLKKSEVSEQKIKTRVCKACGFFNEEEARFCEACNIPLTNKIAIEMQERNEIASKGFKRAMSQSPDFKVNKDILKDVIKDMIRSGEIEV